MKLTEKQILRTTMRTALAEFPAREPASAALRHHLRATAHWTRAAVVYGFHPLPSEPDWIGPTPISDKEIAFPRTEGERMLFPSGKKFLRGAFGLLEPEPGPDAAPPDLILVPGLAFTRDGHRLGRGGGFYDRWLATQTGVPTLAICFSCQLVDTLPTEPHDCKVDAVLTEEGLLGGGG